MCEWEQNYNLGNSGHNRTSLRVVEVVVLQLDVAVLIDEDTMIMVQLMEKGRQELVHLNIRHIKTITLDSRICKTRITTMAVSVSGHCSSQGLLLR